MQKIQKLPQHIVSKIAAGEVIERPSFAVKELLENSIDAGASVIEVHVEESGLKRITIIDNGEGMSKEDLFESFKPHTTSKIVSEDELLSIKTLGFRGEALSSIAAISTMSLKTRTPQSPGGTVVTLRNGVLENSAPVGMPVGTIVTVDQLFSSVPARKKFLKSAKTEFRHITDVIMHFALSYPKIHFVLTHNKKTVLDLPRKDRLEERIQLLFGEALFEQLMPLSFEDGYIRIEGYIGRPQVTSRNNQRQYIFVNNRHVSDKLIALAAKEGYGTLLPASSTPVFQLRITLPFEAVDVNVHPRKELVNFLNKKAVFDAIKLAITQTLAENNVTFHLAKFKQESSAKRGETTSFAGSLLKETVLPWNRVAVGERVAGFPLIQAHQTYLITSVKEGIALYDQHAVHESILYEQFVKAFSETKKKKEVYSLSKPFPLHLSLLEKQVLEEYMEVFTHVGFSFEPFQGNTFLIRDIPVIFKGRKVEKIIRDMLDDLSQFEGVKHIDTASQRMLAFLSCRAAVKAGDVLPVKQREQLIKQLEKTQHNVTCPHGRPTKIILTKEQLASFFKR